MTPSQKQVAMTVEARAALMDLAEKVSAMRAEAEQRDGLCSALTVSTFTCVLEAIVAELDRK